MLFERRLDRRERGLQLGAKTRDHWNDRDCDSRRDQAILDRRRGVLVFQESNDQAHQRGLSKVVGRI
jgi:hypothetical protein